MSIATRNKEAREWLIGKMMPEDMADAVLDMDDIAFSEGLGPRTKERLADWEVLVNIAGETSKRKSDRRRWEEGRKKTK